jgi:hypothetical protein
MMPLRLSDTFVEIALRRRFDLTTTISLAFFLKEARAFLKDFLARFLCIFAGSFLSFRSSALSPVRVIFM